MIKFFIDEVPLDFYEENSDFQLDELQVEGLKRMHMMRFMKYQGSESKDECVKIVKDGTQGHKIVDALREFVGGLAYECTKTLPSDRLSFTQIFERFKEQEKKIISR